MRLWCNGKRWGLSFCLVGFCICTFCMYRSPCQQLSEMKKMGREHREEWNSPVRGVCGCSFLGMSCVGLWLSCSDSILLFVPCDLGSVRGCKSISAILLCRIAFSLVPVGRHQWACFFWLVAGTNAHGCSSGCYMRCDWVVSGLFQFSLFLCFFLIRKGLFVSVFITTESTETNSHAKLVAWLTENLIPRARISRVPTRCVANYCTLDKGTI